MAKKPAYAASRKDYKKNAAVRTGLISWFRENGRDLPWRRTRDPWRILVSEVMLQQIQVARAIPFYERFVRSFPTVGALAEAPLAEAIRVWDDLGRYRRVVNLHRTARIVVEEHGGRIPADPEVLVTLPGVGPYTAGAVACFAFERDVSFFDTNMHRVLHRVYFGPEVPEPAAKPKELLALAAGLVPAGEGWTWNQAVMEFGALQCTARNPRCDGCPVAGHCRAHPVMPEALAAITRATKGEPGRRYEDSNRYLRGRVLAQLRDTGPDGGLELREIWDGLRRGGVDVEASRLWAAVRSLEDDGLARTAPAGDPGAGPPAPRPAEAAAEERAAYGAEDGDLARVRVALP
ncbi:MAG: A/G-specific adenine glycosylase [uncultured Rubrobacteraceae bacterium]|uniref:Adenine DNA glycosylase n=1 Tax=uncultured Rubrobacteraceae bacterium TaxID=349277 RepID=A0A6J4RLS3_9ACTN|nr:MAG: A/G-specific adenine glycosylase [uncultured Rubrobacteraceae bacterium]